MGGNEVIICQHDSHIHGRGGRGQQEGQEQTDILRLRIRQQEQHESGQDIALMHLCPQDKHQLQGHGRARVQIRPALFQIETDSRRHGQEHEGHPDLPIRHLSQQRPGIFRPVAPQQEHEVPGGQCGIVIAAQCADVLVHQPQETFLFQGKGNDDHQGHGHRRRQADPDPPDIFPVTHFHDQGKDAQRGQQPRLRLDQNGQREHRNRPLPVTLPGHGQEQDDQQRRRRIDLSPTAAGNDIGRVKGKDRREHQGRFGPLAANQTIQEQRQGQVTKLRNQLENDLDAHPRITDAKCVHQMPDSTQHQHIGRGIIAEIARLIKRGRSARGHFGRPGAETADVHAIAADVHGQDDPNPKCRKKDQDQRDPLRFRVQPDAAPNQQQR